MHSLGTRDGFDYVGNGRAKKKKKSRRRGKEEGNWNWAERGKTREKEREWQRTSGKLPDQRVTYVQRRITVRIPTALT